MAAIGASIELQDNFSAQMERVISTMERCYDMTENLREKMSAPISMPDVNMPAWISDPTAPLTTTGLERYSEEVDLINEKLEWLGNIQDDITSRMENANILPPEAMSDMELMQARLEGIRSRIAAIEKNPVNIGSDRVNNELERMRAQLTSALMEQEELNDAVSDMDIERANRAYLEMSRIVSNTEMYLRDNTDEQGRFNDEISRGTALYKGMGSVIRKAVGGALAFIGARSISDYISGGMEKYAEKMNAETQLKVTLTNMIDPESSVTEAFNSIQDKANEIAGHGIYTESAMITAGAEFSTYMTDTDAIDKMMDTLSNYAAGMSGGVELDDSAMLNYATNLGKIMTGAYDAMTKKGFEFSKAQKAVIDGTATSAEYAEVLGSEWESMTDDMRAAEAISQVINDSWDGLYDSVSNLPQNKITQMTQSFTELRTEVGGRLIPVIGSIAETIMNNFGQIETIVFGVTKAVAVLARGFAAVASGASRVVGFFQSHWSTIAPIVLGAASALAVYKAATLGLNAALAINAVLHGQTAIQKSVAAAASMMASGATLAETAAQHGLNAALLACPITWVVAGIIALIAATYAASAAIAKHTGVAQSAFGVIMGGLNTLKAFAINMVIVPLHNKFAAFANFVGNVFNDPVSAVKVLFYDMALTVIGHIQHMAKAIETIINKIPGVQVSITAGLDNFYSKLEEAQQKVKDESGWVEYVGKMDYMDYGDAFKAGAAWGDGISAKVSGWWDSLSGNIALEEDLGYGHGISDDISDIASSVGGIKNSLDLTADEMKYLRDIAEREVVNRFTTAEIHVDMSGMQNSINSEMDIDGFVDKLTDAVNDAVDYMAEGVHY